VEPREALQERASAIVEVLSASGRRAFVIPGSLRQYQIKVQIEAENRAYSLDLYFKPKNNDFSLKCQSGDEHLDSLLEPVSERWPSLIIANREPQIDPVQKISSQPAVDALEGFRRVSAPYDVEVIRQVQNGGTGNFSATLEIRFGVMKAKATVSLSSSGDIRFKVHKGTPMEAIGMLEDLWDMALTRRPRESALVGVGRLLTELAPYRTVRLDLLPLLERLRSAAPDENIPCMPYRYDFDMLEQKYCELVRRR
jgi:hypothetical protein